VTQSIPFRLGKRQTAGIKRHDSNAERTTQKLVCCVCVQWIKKMGSFEKKEPKPIFLFLSESKEKVVTPTG
jgi:hypothetical protein